MTRAASGIRRAAGRAAGRAAWPLARLPALVAVLTLALATVLVGQATGRPAWAVAGPSAGTVFLRTVPAVPGLALRVGGVVATTDAAGAAVVPVADLNGVAATVRLVSGRIDGTTSARIARLAQGPHVPHQSHLVIGLDLFRRVRLVLRGGTAHVPVRDVRSLRLHAVTGQVVTLDPRHTRTVTLAARQVRLVHNVVVSQPVTWAVDRVDAGSGVAITTGARRFDPLHRRAWRLTLAPVSGTVDIDTVPATPGVSFVIDGATGTTGPAGRARIAVTDLNHVSDRLLLDSPTADGLLVSRLRVDKLPPLAVHERHVIAALDVRRPVQLVFTDLRGALIDPHTLGSVRLSGGGSDLELVGDEITAPVALLTQVTTKVAGAWQVDPVTYSAAYVGIDGSNAVFQGRQRFSARDAPRWTIALAVFTTTVTVHDVLFGSSLGSRAVLTRPDGSTRPVTLRSGGPTVLSSMVRGTYGLQVDEAVVGGTTTLLVSRDDSVDLRVVTLPDAVLIVVVMLALAVGVVVVGRRLSLRRADEPGEP